MQARGQQSVVFKAADNRWLSIGGWAVAFGLALLNYRFPRWAFVIPWSIHAAVWLFSVRGYQVRDGSVQVLFLCCAGPAYSLCGLEGVRRKAPGLLQDSFRSFGTGVFSHVGLYRHRKLGWYRGFFTCQQTLVWLQFTRKSVVVSPADPDAFVGAIMSQIPAPPSTLDS